MKQFGPQERRGRSPGRAMGTQQQTTEQMGFSSPVQPQQPYQGPAHRRTQSLDPVAPARSKARIKIRSRDSSIQSRWGKCKV